ncbi:MAG: hypothetical protein J5626_02440 [Lachnospiraceae bacterium]|nr:hypothetical protein [Lachnospiraceae bacterium]
MMDEKLIRDSLLEITAIYADSYDNGRYTFSAGTSRKIKQLIFREKHPVTYVMKNVAAIFIVLLLSGTIILGSSETAQAAVISWITEVFEGTFLYRGQFDSDVDISAYSIRDFITADFEYSEADSYMSDKEMCETYTDAEGYYLYLYVIRATEGKASQILPDEGDEVKQEIIGDITVEHYFSSDGYSNAYVWHDEDGTLFYLGGRITENKLNGLAVSFMQKYKK